MARIWSTGFELQSVVSGVEFSVSGSPSISTTTVRSGAASLRANPSGASHYVYKQIAGIGTSVRKYMRFYIRIASAPTALASIAKLSETTSVGGAGISIRLNTNRTLELWDDADPSQIGSDSPALALDTWYRIELTQQTDGEDVSARIDGVEFASATGLNGIVDAPASMYVGAVTTQTSDLYFDDVAINDTSMTQQNSWPGEGKIVHLRPNGPGESSAATAVGAATLWQALDEVTPNDATDYVQLTSTTDNFLVTMDSTGTAGLAITATINVIQVGARIAAASAAVANTTLQMKDPASGVTYTGSATSHNQTAWNTHDDTVSTAWYRLTSHSDATTMIPWTPTQINQLQIGATTSDATPNPLISTMWALVEYVPPLVPPSNQTIASDHVISSSAAFGTLFIYNRGKLVPTSIASTLAFSTTLIKNFDRIAPTSIAPTTVIGTPNISNYVQYISDHVLDSTESFASWLAGGRISNFMQYVLALEVLPGSNFDGWLTGGFADHRVHYIRPVSTHGAIAIAKPDVIGELAPNDTAPSYEFYRRTVLPIRNINAAAMISFIKGYDPDADFFTVGTSAFDGGDVWQGDGSTAQEWDKFDFTDYSDHLRSFTYRYEQDVLGSMILGYADLVLNNVGDLFSPYGESEIADLILPARPLKLFTGYPGMAHQVFVGQTTKLPDTTSETATFYAMDFIASFADKEITDGRVYAGVTTDQVIDDLLQTDAGLSPVQYTLDTGLNTIGFLHVEPGQKVGEVMRKLVEAEQGRVYQTYDGEIRFDNRNNKLRSTAIKISSDQVYSEKEPKEGNVINRVKINSDVRAVQPSQQIYPGRKDGSTVQYDDFSAIKLAPGETIDQFFDFKDPITSITHPSVGAGVAANSQQDGLGTNQNAALSFAVAGTFTDSVKYSFTNTSGADIYVTQCTIMGTPAIIIKKIRVDVLDSESIGKYGEELLTIDNNYFTDEDYAIEIATEIIASNRDAPNTREIVTKGIPYAAVADVITYYDGLTYAIDEIVGTVSASAGHTQSMRLRRVELI